MSRALIGHQTMISVGRRKVVSLSDIVPDAGPMRMLLIGKTPVPLSVEAGHYFQGRQGSFMWSELVRSSVLDVRKDEYHDDALIRQGFGITDVVKAPRDFGSEPSQIEYGEGWLAVADLIERLRPAVTFWVYKGTLDTVLRVAFNHRSKASYGFNPRLNQIIGASVFAFGMIGTPCTGDERRRGMTALRRRLARSSGSGAR